MLTTMQGLVVDVMYVHQGKLKISRGDDEYQ